MTNVSHRARRGTQPVVTSLERRLLFTAVGEGLTTQIARPAVTSAVGARTADQAGSGPTLTSIDPALLVAGQGYNYTTIALTGTGFLPGSVVDEDGVALSTSFLSSTNLSAELPIVDSSAIGTLSITVATPGLADTAPQTLTVTGDPTLTNMIPSSAVVGSSDTPVTLIGSDFLPGAVVHLGGVAVATTFVNSTQLAFTVPAADLAAAGTIGLFVANPPGHGDAGYTGEAFWSTSAQFTITTSVALTAITPASLMVDSPTTTVTLTGTNFQPTSVAYVTVPEPFDSGGLTLAGSNTYTGSTPIGGTGTTVPTASNGDDGTLATTYVSPTELTAAIPGSDLTVEGWLQIQVQSGTLGNTANAYVAVALPAPTLTGIGPATATVQSPDLTVTLTGANFEWGSVAEDNGVPLATTVVTGTELTAVVPAADLTTVGSQSITVANYDDVFNYAMTTTARTFNVTPPPPGLWSTVAAGTVPAKVATGARVGGVAQVKLTDTAGADERGVTLVRLYAVPLGSTAGSAGTLLATVKRKTALAAGASQSLAIPVKALPSSTAGDYRLLTTTTDPAGHVLTAVAGPVVTVGPSDSSLAVSVVPTTLVAGRQATLTVTVSDIGNVDSTGRLYLDISIEPDPSNSMSFPVLETRQSVRVRTDKPLILQFKVGKAIKGLTAGSYNWAVRFDQGSQALETTNIPLTITAG